MPIPGLIIQEATYGPAETELEDLDEGLWLDVTIPVQALVRKSQLHISGGDSKVGEETFSHSLRKKLTHQWLYDTSDSAARVLGPRTLCLQVLTHPLLVPWSSTLCRNSRLYACRSPAGRFVSHFLTRRFSSKQSHNMKSIKSLLMNGTAGRDHTLTP